jgi:hypothetical protein
MPVSEQGLILSGINLEMRNPLNFQPIHKKRIICGIKKFPLLTFYGRMTYALGRVNFFRFVKKLLINYFMSVELFCGEGLQVSGVMALLRINR